MSVPRIESIPFNRRCYAISLVLLAAAFFGGLRLFPIEKNGQEFHDFSQFYMGAVIAREGAWDDLYPIPHADSLNNPGEWKDSEMRPRYAELAAKAGVPAQATRFIQPPPFAILLRPLAGLGYHNAKRVWNVLMVLCVWGVAMMAGRSYELAAGRSSRCAGLIALLVAICPLTIETLRLMNIAPLIALLAGTATFGLITGSQETGAAALIVGAVAKYATAPLLPLYAAMRKWRAIGAMLGLSALILAASYWWMGSGPFVVFFREMLPTYLRPHTLEWNRSIYAVLMRATHVVPFAGWPLGLARIMQWGAFAALMAILFTRSSGFWALPRHVFAAAAAMLCWFLIFSPTFWDQYLLYLAPMWGWLVWEARQSIFKSVLIFGGVIYQCLPGIITESDAFQKIHLSGPEGSFMLLTVLVFLGIAIVRLLRNDVGRIENPARLSAGGTTPYPHERVGLRPDR